MTDLITKDNLEYCRTTIQLKEILEQTFISLAERLFNIREKNMWQAEFSSWDEFLMELKLNQPTASKLISVYKKYVIDFGIPTEKLKSVRSWESLYAVRSLAVSQEKALELVEHGAIMSDKDMRAMTKNAPLCDNHDWYTIRICKNCGLKEKLHENDRSII